MPQTDNPSTADAIHAGTETAEIRRLLAEVTDPEIPVLTIEDLGILRNIEWQGGRLAIEITPTYSGCPALRAIESEIVEVLKREGFSDVSVRTQLSPAWTTGWMSETGRRKLLEYGIAPPGRCGSVESAQVNCPRCGSGNTEEISHFGSTACKALCRCRECLEPFDHFKCI
ncbi:MAG: 1,2-phenylacetyl-CoA epoxidase subunit PaaD [Gammaproteobacteria bacterium]